MSPDFAPASWTAPVLWRFAQLQALFGCHRISRQRLGLRQPFRLRGAPKRRSGATAAGALPADEMSVQMKTGRLGQPVNKVGDDACRVVAPCAKTGEESLKKSVFPKKFEPRYLDSYKKWIFLTRCWASRPYLKFAG
jgi:hypothetical protein